MVPHCPSHYWCQGIGIFSVAPVYMLLSNSYIAINCTFWDFSIFNYKLTQCQLKVWVQGMGTRYGYLLVNVIHHQLVCACVCLRGQCRSLFLSYYIIMETLTIGRLSTQLSRTLRFLWVADLCYIWILYYHRLTAIFHTFYNLRILKKKTPKFTDCTRWIQCCS